MLCVFTLIEQEYKSQYDVNDQLILKIAKGDKQAFRALYENTHKSVYGFALSITKNSYDAEDVLQETFVTIYQKALSYQPQKKPMAWVFTIAKNHALTKIRQQSKLCELNTETVFSQVDFKSIENAEARMTLACALNVLNDRERQIVLLHAHGGLKNREIAQILGISINTVLSAYNRAIKKLKNAMESEMTNHE